MQNCLLVPHPATPCKTVQRVEAGVSVEAGAVQTRFHVVGDVSHIVLPASLPPKRQDELWRHTCCELFVRASETSDYYEFNFSPSTAWAAYRFSSYRAAMTTAEITGPQVALEVGRNFFTLTATVHLRECLGLRGDCSGALTCVIEEFGNKLSYWAVAHPPGKPDFHHSDSYCLPLPAVRSLQAAL